MDMRLLWGRETGFVVVAINMLLLRSKNFYCCSYGAENFFQRHALMLLQENFAQSFHSPVVRILLVGIGIGLLYVLWREVRKIPPKLLTLMATAFVDMVGLVMIIPLLPFYVKTLGCSGVDVFGFHLGIGIIVGFIIAAFTVAQLLSAPMW